MTETDKSGRLEANRREIIMSLAGAGLLAAAGTASGSAGVGGGDMSNQGSEFRVQVFRGEVADRPDAGQHGRVWITPDGTRYFDDGESWEAVPVTAPSVSAESVAITDFEFEQVEDIDGNDVLRLTHESGD